MIAQADRQHGLQPDHGRSRSDHQPAGPGWGWVRVSTLTSDDAKAIKDECSAVKEVAPTWGGVTQVVYGNQNWNTSVTGTTPSFFDLREWPMAARAACFTDQESAGRSRWPSWARAYRGKSCSAAENPLGQIIRIKKVPFTVIGVLSRKGQSARGARSGRRQSISR